MRSCKGFGEDGNPLWNGEYEIGDFVHKKKKYNMCLHWQALQLHPYRKHFGTAVLDLYANVDGTIGTIVIENDGEGNGVTWGRA